MDQTVNEYRLPFLIQAICSTRNMLDNGTPTVLILERLIRQGWDKGQAPALHDASTARVFGQDKFSNKKHYLQCLLSLDQIRQKGLIALPSGQSSWYYRAVLASEHPAHVARGAPAKEYKALLFGDGQENHAGEYDGAGPRLAILDASASEGQSDIDDAAISVVLPGALADEEPVDNESSGQLALSMLPPVQSAETPGQAADTVAASTAAPPREAPAPSASSESASEEIGGEQIVALGPRGQFVPSFSLRQPVHECIHVEEHLSPGMPGHYRRYTTICPLASTGHCSVIACGKRRNCGVAQMGNLGPAAPEAFLMVWREQASSFGTKADHQRWSPTWSEVRRYMVAQGWPVGS